MRINFVINYSKQLGGAELVNFKLVKELQASNINALVLSVSDIPKKSRYLDLLVNLTNFINTLKSDLKGQHSFVLNVLGVETIFYAIAISIAKPKSGIFFWEHNHKNFLDNRFTYKILKTLFYRKANFIIKLHPDFFEHPKRVNEIFIPNIQEPIDSKILPKIRKRFIWIGRNSPEKRLHLALKLFNKAKKIDPELLLHIYTPDSFSNCHHKLSEDVRFLNGRNGIPFGELNNDSILLSTSTLEAMPTVIFEALSNDIPVISTRSSPWVLDLERIGFVKSIDEDCSGEHLIECCLSFQKGISTNIENCMRSRDDIIEAWRLILNA